MSVRILAPNPADCQTCVRCLVFNRDHMEAIMATTLKPGQTATRSGQYRNTSTGREVTATRGEPLPPTPKTGQRYTLVDPTKHKR